MTNQQAMDWLKQLVNLLDLIHQENLIHRDIKPNNVMLRVYGKLALIDFGGVRELTEIYLRRRAADSTGTVSGV